MSEESWYLQRGKSASIGPFTTEEIVEGLLSGEIPSDSMVCAVDGKQWLPLDAIEAFREALKGRPTKPSSPEPAPSPATVTGSPPTTATGSLPATAPKPRPRPAPRPRAEDEPPSPARLRVVSIVAGACAAVSLARLVLAVARPRAMTELVDAARAVRLDLGIGAALAATAWITIAVTALPGRRRVGAQVLAAGAPLVGSLVVSAIAIVRVRSAVTLGDADLIVRAQHVVAIFAIASLTAYAVVLATLARNVAAAARRALAPTAIVTAVALAVAALVHVGVSRSEVVPLAIESDVPVPLFAEEESVRSFVAGTRAGASGLPDLDRALGRAAFVEPGTRARVVDEQILEAEGGPVLLRKVVPLDGPHAGETLVWVVR